MKKILIVLLIIIIAAGAFIYLSHGSSDGDKVQMRNYVQNGIKFTYPSDWVVSQLRSNYSVAAISLISSIDSKGIGQVNILIEKHNFTGDFDKFVNTSCTSLNANENYNLTSYGNMLIKNINVTQVTYNSMINGTSRMHKSVWFEHGNDAYVITYSAPPSQYDKYEKIFEYVVSSFQIS